MEIPGLGSVPLHKRARVLALVALASFACGGSSGSTSSGGGAPYVVGITTDLTQATSAAGVPLRDGITTYFKFVNAHGGINGHKVQVIALDDQSKPDLGIANLKQLAQQYHAVAVTGFSTSSVQGALYPYLDQYQAIVVGKDTVSTDVSGPKMIRWVYQASIVNALGVTAQVDYAITLNKGNPIKLATLSAPTAGGLESRSRAEAYARSRGSTVVASIDLPVTAIDAVAQVNQTLDSRADAVVSAHGDKYMILYIQGLRSRNSQVPVLNSPGGSALTTLQQLNGPNFYVLRGIAYSTDTSPGVKDMVRELKAAGLNPDTSSISDGWLEALTIGEGLRKCGDGCTGARLQKAMDGLNIDTRGLTAANVKFTPTDHIGLQSGSIWHWMNGQAVKAAASVAFH